jgi:hypothetical protein
MHAMRFGSLWHCQQHHIEFVLKVKLLVKQLFGQWRLTAATPAEQ